MKNARIISVILALAMVFALCVCGTASAEGNTLHYAWTSDIETYDVHQTTADYQIPLNVYDRLFELVIIDGSATLVNSLVKDYSVSDDGLVFSFELRDDVCFSNGNQLTADDVAYSFTRMVALENSEQEYLFECVAGYEEFDYSGNYHDAVLTGIEVADATHFTMTLTKPYAGFLNILASPACCIYEKASVEAAGDAYGSDPAYAIGSGAYVIDNWNHDSGMDLSLNPCYWGETPDFDKVEIQIVPDAETMNLLFQSGELDVLDCDQIDAAVVAATYKTLYADQMIASNRLGTAYMALNASTEAFADVAARKAVQMAIDRQTIVDTILNGDARLVDGIYPNGLVGYTEDNQGWLAYDPEGAVAVLEAAGYTKDANGYYFSFEIANDNNNSATRQLVIQVIEQQLRAVGIDCTITNYDHSSWLALRRAGDMEAYVSTWTADYNDPDNFIATFWGSSDSTKGRSLGYADEDVMARVAAAPAIIDDAERLAEYAALESKIVNEDASWVPLYQQTHLFVISENLESFVPHWAGYSDFQFASCTAK